MAMNEQHGWLESNVGRTVLPSASAAGALFGTRADGKTVRPTAAVIKTRTSAAPCGEASAQLYHPGHSAHPAMAKSRTHVPRRPANPPLAAGALRRSSRSGPGVESLPVFRRHRPSPRPAIAAALRWTRHRFLAEPETDAGP